MSFVIFGLYTRMKPAYLQYSVGMGMGMGIGMRIVL